MKIVIFVALLIAAVAAAPSQLDEEQPNDVEIASESVDLSDLSDYESVEDDLVVEQSFRIFWKKAKNSLKKISKKFEDVAKQEIVNEIVNGNAMERQFAEESSQSSEGEEESVEISRSSDESSEDGEVDDDLDDVVVQRSFKKFWKKTKNSLKKFGKKIEEVAKEEIIKKVGDIVKNAINSK